MPTEADRPPNREPFFSRYPVAAAIKGEGTRETNIRARGRSGSTRRAGTPRGHSSPANSLNKEFKPDPIPAGQFRLNFFFFFFLSRPVPPRFQGSHALMAPPSQQSPRHVPAPAVGWVRPWVARGAGPSVVTSFEQCSCHSSY